MADYASARAAAEEEFLWRTLSVYLSCTPPEPAHYVAGLSFGTKITGGSNTGQPCLRFYVERKLAEDEVPTEWRIPRYYRGIATDVVESGRFFAGTAQAAAPHRPAARRGPIAPGASIGFAPPAHESPQAGTLSAFVNRGGANFLLSNNHVLAGVNRQPLGSPIFQPAIKDGGNPARDRIGCLSSYVPIESAGSNRVDCALAALDPDVNCDPSFPAPIGKLASAAPIQATQGMQVHKVGRSTGYSLGIVADTGVSLTARFATGGAFFTNQVMIEGAGMAFAEDGDSGAVVIDRLSRRAAALVFAVSESQHLTAANPIAAVLDALDASLLV